jgi:hypothetical protein
MLKKWSRLRKWSQSGSDHIGLDSPTLCAFRPGSRHHGKAECDHAGAEEDVLFA